MFTDTQATTSLPATANSKRGKYVQTHELSRMAIGVMLAITAMLSGYVVHSVDTAPKNGTAPAKDAVAIVSTTSTTAAAPKP